jgi:hypothetical protein
VVLGGNEGLLGFHYHIGLIGLFCNKNSTKLSYPPPIHVFFLNFGVLNFDVRTDLRENMYINYLHFQSDSPFYTVLLYLINFDFFFFNWSCVLTVATFEQKKFKMEQDGTRKKITVTHALALMKTEEGIMESCDSAPLKRLRSLEEAKDEKHLFTPQVMIYKRSKYLHTISLLQSTKGGTHVVFKEALDILH